MKYPYDPDRHRRRSLRLKRYDYTQAGVYFVTIVVRGKLPLFGVVADGKMRLNTAGEMVQRVWGEMSNRFSSIVMDTFIAMPNHIHGIIIVGAPLVGVQLPNGAITTTRATTRVAPTGIQLGDVVGAFKSLTTVEYTRSVRSGGWTPFHGRLWQRNFYEHIVRTDESLERIRQYILDNPVQWAFDRENPMAVNPKQDSP